MITLEQVKTLINGFTQRTNDVARMIVNPDWNENNPEKSAYIKNRPFYNVNGKVAKELDANYLPIVPIAKLPDIPHEKLPKVRIEDMEIVPVQALDLVDYTNPASNYIATDTQFTREFYDLVFIRTYYKNKTPLVFRFYEESKITYGIAGLNSNNNEVIISSPKKIYYIGRTEDESVFICKLKRIEYHNIYTKNILTNGMCKTFKLQSPEDTELVVTAESLTGYNKCTKLLLEIEGNEKIYTDSLVCDIIMHNGAVTYPAGSTTFRINLGKVAKGKKVCLKLNRDLSLGKSFLTATIFPATYYTDEPLDIFGHELTQEVKFPLTSNFNWRFIQMRIYRTDGTPIFPSFTTNTKGLTVTVEQFGSET